MANETSAPTTASPRRFQNRPRVRGVQPVSPNATLLATVTAAIGGKERLLNFLKVFTKTRFDRTGWRSIKDIASRDTKHAAAKAGEPATQPLDKPFESLTATLAAIVEKATNGETKMTRDESLSVIAALADDAATLDAAGIRIWDAYNENLEYSTLGMAALPSGQIPAGARDQADELDF